MLPVVWVPARCGAKSARPSGRTGIGARTFGAPQQGCCRTCSEREHADEKKVYHIVILLQHTHTLPMVPAHMWLTCLSSMFKPNVAHGIFCFHALIRLINATHQLCAIVLVLCLLSTSQTFNLLSSTPVIFCFNATLPIQCDP